MAWGNSGNIDTTNLDAGTDSPALARADLKAALDELTAVINGRGTSNGVASLNANNKILTSELPNTITSDTDTDLTLDPNTDKVNIQHILNLNPQTTSQLQSRSDIAQGDIAFCSDGDAGSECIAVAVAEDDSAGNPVWKVVSIGTFISST